MSNLSEATAKLVDVLTTFNSEERLRIVRASLMLLGDEFNTSTNSSRGSKGSEPSDGNGDEHTPAVSSLAQQWLKKNGVTLEHAELKVGTLAGLLRQAGVSAEDFIAAL